MIFLFIQIVAAVKIRVDQTFIPDDWISSTYLKKCFERKGVESEGFIQSFHENFGRFGKKKVSYKFARLHKAYMFEMYIIRTTEVLLAISSQETS